MKKARLFAILSTLLLMAQMGVGQTLEVDPASPPAGRYSFQVNELDPAASILGSSSTPYYHYFYECGDGYFMDGTAVPMYHVYRKSGEFTAYARVHPVKSSSGQPPLLSKTTEVTGGPGVYESLLEEEAYAKIVSSWGGEKIRAEEKITIVLIYKYRDGTVPSGKVSLLYNTNTLLPDFAIDPREHHGEIIDGSDVAYSGDPRYNARVAWRYNFQMNQQQQYEEHTIFIDATVKTSDLSKLDLAVLVEPDRDGETDQDDISMTISTANDPNDIIFDPPAIIKGVAPVPIVATVHFKNDGDALANKITIDVDMHPGFNPYSVQILETKPNGFIELPGGYATSDTKLQFKFEGAGLIGTGFPDIINSDFAKGYVKFLIYTNPAGYDASNELTGTASIVFESLAPVITEPATVQLISPQTGDCPTTDDYTLWIVLGILFFLLLIFIAWLIAQNQTS